MTNVKQMLTVLAPSNAALMRVMREPGNLSRLRSEAEAAGYMLVKSG